MMYWLKCKIPREFSVHHINEDKLDCRKENLSVVFGATHVSKHNKGKIVSEDTRKLMAASNRRRKGIKMNGKRSDVTIEKIMELKNKGYCLNWIAKELKCDWAMIRRRIREFENQDMVKKEV